MAQFQISIYTLSNFILMEEAEPEDFEVYLLITKDEQMSAACYTTGTLYPQGVFRQSPKERNRMDLVGFREKNMKCKNNTPVAVCKCG